MHERHMNFAKGNGFNFHDSRSVHTRHRVTEKH
jgi:hypothetical protein